MAAHAARRLRRRRPGATARRAAAARRPRYVTGLRARRWYLRRAARRVRALRPARAPRRCRSSRRGSARTTVSCTASGSLPARADPVQLAVERSRASRSRACRAASSTDLPVGLALVGRPSGEATVLRAAHAFQRVTDWHGGVRRQPSGRSRGSGVRAGSDLRSERGSRIQSTLSRRKVEAHVGSDQGRPDRDRGRRLRRRHLHRQRHGLADRRVARRLPPTRSIDAAGKFVIPGAIDPHTHIEMFFGGTDTCDDFTSGTVSAAFGGTTTLIDFCMQTPGDTFAQALEKYHEKIERCKPVIDVGFHIGVTDLHTGGTLEDLAKLPDEGVTSYKLFMAYKGAVMVDDETLFRTMETAARDGRARDGARRERRRDRHHRQACRRRGQDGADLARPHPADGDRGRGDEPCRPARAGRRLPALRRPRLVPAVGRADRARAREGLGRLGRDVHPVPLHRRHGARAAGLRGREVHLHAAAAAEGAAGAPLEGARRRRALRRSRPTTARSTGRSRRGSTARSSR